MSKLNNTIRLRFGAALLGVVILVGVPAVYCGCLGPPQAQSATQSVVLVLTEQGFGSGVVIRPGVVLTAKHVARQGVTEIEANDGTRYTPTRTVLDPDSDLALVYVDGMAGVPAVDIDATPLEVGDQVVLVGAPGGLFLKNCVLPGTVVKVNVRYVTEDIDYSGNDVLDAHSFFGCSGGPIFDLRGRLRGILTSGLGNLCGAVPIAELDVDL